MVAESKKDFGYQRYSLAVAGKAGGLKEGSARPRWNCVDAIEPSALAGFPGSTD
jgi:hypothetical protein